MPMDIRFVTAEGMDVTNLLGDVAEKHCVKGNILKTKMNEKKYFEILTDDKEMLESGVASVKEIVPNYFRAPLLMGILAASWFGLEYLFQFI